MTSPPEAATGAPVDTRGGVALFLVGALLSALAAAPVHAAFDLARREILASGDAVAGPVSWSTFRHTRSFGRKRH
jgi:hypothetical protein